MTVLGAPSHESPLLVAHVTAIGAREQLLEAARRQAVVYLTPVAAPRDGSLHAIEVYTPDAREPLRLQAEPVGAPTTQGTPLRLSLPAPAPMAVPDLLVPSVPDLDAPPSSRAPMALTSSLVPSLAPPLPSPLDDDVFELGARSSASMLAAAPPAHAESLSLHGSARSLGALLDKIATTQRPDAFAALVAPLGGQVPGMLQGGDVAGMWRLACTLDHVAAEPAGPRSRAEAARQALEIFRHPQVLAPLGVAAIAGREDKDRHVSRLLVRAGKRGARALYQARLKNDSPDARARFVTLLRSVGPAAVPVLSAALELLEPRLGAPFAAAVAEDVLRGVPKVEDAALGAFVARYARAQLPAVAVAATHALAEMYGDRARASLLELLAHPAAEVMVAAMQELGAHGGIDPESLPRALVSHVLTSLAACPDVELRARLEGVARRSLHPRM